MNVDPKNNPAKRALPEGSILSQSGPPVTFVDEPDEYDEAHVPGLESTTAVVVVDPTQDEVVGIMDVQEHDPEYLSNVLAYPAKPIVGKDDEPLGE